jgi:hypothetical protein
MEVFLATSVACLIGLILERMIVIVILDKYAVTVFTIVVEVAWGICGINVINICVHVCYYLFCNSRYIMWIVFVFNRRI